MPKINALPPMTAPAGDDVFPADDVSTTNKDTKKLSLTGLKEWFQSVAGWITTAMIADSQINASKVDWSTAGEVWWEELARVSTGSNVTSISTGTFAAKKYLTVIVRAVNNGSTQKRIQFNNDTGSNYKSRFSVSGAADTDEATSGIGIPVGTTSSEPSFGVLDIVNTPTANEKLVYCNVVQQGTAGAANSTIRMEVSAKWANTANQITRVDLVGSASGLASGSELIVLGHD